MKKLLTTLKQKWAEYLLEMLVITAGILGAFILNSWHEDRKKQVDELYFLSEILNNLKEDSKIIGEITVKREKARISVIRMLQMLSKTEIIPDSLSTHFANYLTFERYYPIRNAYEMSKSTGMKISNKDLRTKISRYYDFEQNKVSSSIADIEMAFHDVIHNKYEIVKQITFFEFAEIIIVKDPNNPDFRRILNFNLIQFRDNNNGTLEKVLYFGKLNQALITDLTEEIRNLE